MSVEEKKTNPLVIGLVIVGVLTLLCCVGGGIASYLGVQRVEEAGGVENAMRGLVADMAGDRDTAARDFFRVAFVERDVESGYSMTSPVFRSVTDSDQFEVLLRAIHRVMGDYQDAQIRNYNANAHAGTGAVTGTVHSLIYDATFVEGPATVHIQLRASERDKSSYEVEMFKVESPRFVSALAGDDAETDDTGTDDTGTEAR